VIPIPPWLLGPLVKYGVALATVAAIVLALLWWGHTKYEAGKADQISIYEKAAAVQRDINAKATFRAIENTAKEVETFTQKETVRETVYVKDKAALADVWRYADRLRDELARRSATPIEATSACAAEQRRLRSAEGIVGEYVEALATCTGVAVEGRDLAQKLSNKNDLWKGYVKALP